MIHSLTLKPEHIRNTTVDLFTLTLKPRHIRTVNRRIAVYMQSCPPPG